MLQHIHSLFNFFFVCVNLCSSKICNYALLSNATNHIGMLQHTANTLNVCKNKLHFPTYLGVPTSWLYLQLLPVTVPHNVKISLSTLSSKMNRRKNLLITTIHIAKPNTCLQHLRCIITVMHHKAPRYILMPLS